MMMVGIAGIVAIVAIAAVLMMGGGGEQAAPQSEEQPSDPVSPSSDTPPASGGQTTEPTSGDSNGALPGIDVTAPMICTWTVTSQGETYTATAKMEPTNKMRMESTFDGIETVVLTSDGSTFYMQNSESEQWMKMTTEPEDMPTPEDMEAYYEDPQGASVTYDCNNVADIPDSEFELPAGADVMDLDAMMQDFEGMEGMEDFDPSMFEGM